MKKSKKILAEQLLKKWSLAPKKTPADLEKIKRKIAKECKTKCPQNVELLKVYHKLLNKKRIKDSGELKSFLKKRPIRSLSGVAVITVLTKPYSCPGKCIYCPKEKYFPKSYLSGEPAAQRARKLNFDPYLQVKKRLESLKIQGHPTDKIELIILGGSFNFYPKKYQENFVAQCFSACNENKKRKNVCLEKEQQKNESGKNRIVGLTIETRPDLINEREIIRFRKLGVTKIEIGVQSANESVLTKNQRGISLNNIKKATRLLKNAGFKITYHMMVGLPGADEKKDIQSFKKIFSDQGFKPDWLKLYPCVVCKGSKLYKIWKAGKYTPYKEKNLVNLLIKIKSGILPYWIRVGRLFRDIPSPKIEAGCKTSNLRELIQRRMSEQKILCKCIRCREIKNNYDPNEKIFLFRENYLASNGQEIFLSFENKKRTLLFAFLRLRIPKEKDVFIRTLKNSAFIRELHTYGQSLQLKKNGMSPQHKGLGKKLMKIAEKITKEEYGINRLAVISGVGVRNYYKKLGYKEKDTYMIKEI